MLRRVRCAAVAVMLVFASLACGSLGALPLGPRVISAEGGFLAEVVEWIASLLTPDRPTCEFPEPTPQTKEGSSMDPQGGSGPQGGGGH